MNTEQRKAMIFEAFYGEHSGILRRYTAPSHLTPDRQRTEIMFMVDDMNEEVPDISAESFGRFIDAVHTQVRRNWHSREWPPIAAFIKAVRAVAGVASQPGSGGDIGRLTAAERAKLDEVLEKARKWVAGKNPALQEHGRKTLAYWGQNE